MIDKVLVVLEYFFLGYASFYTLARFFGEWSNMSWFEWSFMLVLSCGAAIIIYDELVSAKMGHYKETWKETYAKASGGK